MFDVHWKNAGSKKPKVVRTKNGSNSKKSKFIKVQEPSGLLSTLGIKTRLNKIPLLDSFIRFLF